MEEVDTTMASPSQTTATVLRVKRPRHVKPVSLLTLDLDANRQRKRHRNDEDVITQGLEHLMHHSSYVTAQQQRHLNNTVTWKRVQDVSESSKRSIRYVDARLDDDTHNDDELPKPKRRRLALTLLTDSFQEEKSDQQKVPTPQRKKSVVLDPLSRLVDDSLKRVFAGQGTTVSQHLDFIASDPRLTTSNVHKTNWLTWSSQPGGTVLHAAVLFNNVEGVERILRLSLESSPPATNMLLSAVDGDGRTPHEAAFLVGQDGIAKKLDAHATRETKDEEDFVYDMFCVEQEDQHEKEATLTEESISTSPMVELRGGFGYWNEEGELVLETLPEDYDLDREDENDEEDSNCEDYEGNDYPEEREWESTSSSDDDENDCNYRNLPIGFVTSGGSLELQRNGKVGVMHPTITSSYPHGSSHDSDDDAYYDDIDAQYDHYGSSAQPERLYAYDFELDDENNMDGSYD